LTIDIFQIFSLFLFHATTVHGEEYRFDRMQQVNGMVSRTKVAENPPKVL